MLPAAIATQSVTRLRGVETADSHSNTYVDWTTPDEELLEGCYVDEHLGTEDLNGRDSVIWVAVWYGQPDHDLLSADRIRTSDGRVFEVDGPVVPKPDPTGNGLDHQMCKLARVEG